jgi:hypothetical protein
MVAWSLPLSLSWKTVIEPSKETFAIFTRTPFSSGLINADVLSLAQGLNGS